jgi:hypothetical protein
MWPLIKALIAKMALIKVILSALRRLGWLLPLAVLLKAIGLPLLLIALVLAVPLFLVLVAIGLPMIMLFAVGGILLIFTLWLLNVGFFLLKLAIPVILLYWVFKWLSRNGKKHDAPPDAA